MKGAIMTGLSKSIGMLSTIILIITVSAMAAEFTADYTENVGERITSGKIMVTGSKYRLDIANDRMKIRVMVNPKTNQTTMLDMDKLEYRLFETDGRLSAMSDPFQAYEQSKEFYEETVLGEETIGGYKCTKYRLAMNDTPVMTKWFSEELGIPLKIISHGDPERIIVLSNIKMEAVRDELFAVPDGFKAWVDPASLPGERPEWADALKDAPIMEPPFEHSMTAGQVVRIKIVPGKSLAVKAFDASEGTDARMMPFRGDNPLKEEKTYGNFADKEAICDRCHVMNGEADEYVIRVYKGSLTVKAKFIDMFEKILSAGDECHYRIDGFDNIETRFINLTDGTSIAKFEYYENGQPMPDETPEKYKTIKLKNPWDTNNITRTSKGEEFVVRVIEGKMQIKLGQYDIFEF